MCSKQGKTTDHIYQCPHHEAEACRADGCRNLLTTMAKMTPDSLLTAIEILLSDSSTIKLDGQHQFQQLITNQWQLGYFSFLRGHISINWRVAFVEAAGVTASPTIDQRASIWMVKLIKELWSYSKKVWASRNVAVHGHTAAFTTSQELKSLHEEAKSWYRKYEADPYIIPGTRRYLLNKPVSSISLMNRNSLKCWCSLVKEAELTAEQREELLYKQQQHTLHHYFKAQQSRHTNTGSKHKPSIFSPVFPCVIIKGPKTERADLRQAYECSSWQAK